MPESDLLRLCELEATRLGARLFRNNVALAWVGKLFRPTAPTKLIVPPGSVVLHQARPLHAGLCEGSSDLIGWKTVTITPEMVGTKVALFTATELKFASNNPTPEQAGFVQAVRSAGGIGIVAWSVEQFRQGFSR